MSSYSPPIYEKNSAPTRRRFAMRLVRDVPIILRRKRLCHRSRIKSSMSSESSDRITSGSAEISTESPTWLLASRMFRNIQRFLRSLRTADGRTTILESLPAKIFFVRWSKPSKSRLGCRKRDRRPRRQLRSSMASSSHHKEHSPGFLNDVADAETRLRQVTRDQSR